MLGAGISRSFGRFEVVRSMHQGHWKVGFRVEVSSDFGPRQARRGHLTGRVDSERSNKFRMILVVAAWTGLCQELYGMICVGPAVRSCMGDFCRRTIAATLASTRHRHGAPLPGVREGATWAPRSCVRRPSGGTGRRSTPDVLWLGLCPSLPGVQRKDTESV